MCRGQVAVIEDMRPESVLVETELFPAGSIHFVRAARPLHHLPS